MKEASGEANMTVITIVLIGVVLAAGTMIVNSMMNSTRNSSACSACGGTWKGGKCTDSNGHTVDYSACKNQSTTNVK